MLAITIFLLQFSLLDCFTVIKISISLITYYLHGKGVLNIVKIVKLFFNSMQLIFAISFLMRLEMCNRLWGKLQSMLLFYT